MPGDRNGLGVASEPGSENYNGESSIDLNRRPARGTPTARRMTKADREIARMAGADHKTVAAARPQTREIPTEAGEIPTAADDSGEGDRVS